MINVNQENLYLLLPGKVTDVVTMYARAHHVSYLKALTKFYKSKTYGLLEQEGTKFWHLGPVALYEEFVSE